MRALFVMDPVGGIDPAGDTTSALMEAAAAAGHELWVTELHRLEATPAPLALAQRIQVAPWFAAEKAERLPLDLVDAVFIRTDPPFDERYLWAMHILDLVDRRRTLLINDPAGIRAANEKLYSLKFPELIPPTLVSADRDATKEFVRRHGVVVVKPIDGHAGRGVLKVDAEDPNLSSILDMQTGFGTHPIVIQAWLDASSGNHRIFMVDGEPLASVNRLPMPGDFRTGDVVEVVELSEAERRLCGQIGAALVRDGLRFVGLDVIAGHLIEVNVTSPGGLRQLERLSGSPFARPIVNRLLLPIDQSLEVMA